jgi:hypothetical protein
MSEYSRLSSRLWWQTVAKVVPSQSRKERVTWLLETAKIKRSIAGGGQAVFDDIVAQTYEYENENAIGGLELKKEKFEDLDGNGVNLVTHWSKQIGAYSAYWPQKELSVAIKGNPNAYDGQPFFSSAHPYNPFDPDAGVYSNDLTSSPSGSYPGACPIDAATVSDITVAIANLAKAIAYVATWKMPNGEDPRFMNVARLYYPPAMNARVQQILNAKFVSGSGGGSQDVEAMIRNFGFAEPVMMTELGANFGGSDTTYYIGMEEVLSNELGAWLYVEREPFSVLYHGPQTDAQLARIRMLQWTTEGRNTIAPGHPFLMLRCKAT